MLQVIKANASKLFAPLLAICVFLYVTYDAGYSTFTIIVSVIALLVGAVLGTIAGNIVLDKLRNRQSQG